jgi:hypothetical protein
MRLRTSGRPAFFGSASWLQPWWWDQRSGKRAALILELASTNLHFDPNTPLGVTFMSNSRQSQSELLDVSLTVSNAMQARELEAAWQDITSGEKPYRAEELEDGLQSIMDRAQAALLLLETSIDDHPTSGQSALLVRFIAGLYNGCDYPFDVSELRELDTKLANACLHYLNYDRYVPGKKMCLMPDTLAETESLMTLLLGKSNHSLSGFARIASSCSFSR